MPSQGLLVSPLGFVSRVVHMLSIAILSGETILNYLLGRPTRPAPSSTYTAVLFAGAGAAAILTGIINWVLFKPKSIMERKDAKVWVGILHTKVVVTLLLFTPITKNVVGVEVPDAIKFYGVLGMVVAAAYMRFFREAATSRFKSKGTTN
jgi:hypothetical protein